MSGHDEHQTAPTTGNPSETGAATLEAELRRLGYEIESTPSADPPTGEIIARREQGDRGILLAVDRGGRFRVELTWLVGEWPSRLELGGIAARSVDRVTRSVSLAGQVSEPLQLLELVTRLGEIVPWAGAESDGPERAGNPAIDPKSPPPS